MYDSASALHDRASGCDSLWSQDACVDLLSTLDARIAASRDDVEREALER